MQRPLLLDVVRLDAPQYYTQDVQNRFSRLVFVIVWHVCAGVCGGDGTSCRDPGCANGGCVNEDGSLFGRAAGRQSLNRCILAFSLTVTLPYIFVQ